jgi:hypothetical protein
MRGIFMNEQEIQKALSLPIPFHWRVQREARGNGICMAYLDSRDVQDRLDEVVGIGNWQSKLSSLNGAVLCELSIKFGDQWITKSDVGDIKKDQLERQLDNAEKDHKWKVINQFGDSVKAEVSSAFKRSAVHFGIGRFTYSMQEQWVKIQDNYIYDGNNKICYKADHKKLTELINNRLTLDELPKLLTQRMKDALTPDELQDIAVRQKHLWKNKNFTDFVKKMKDSFPDPKDI